MACEDVEHAWDACSVQVCDQMPEWAQFRVRTGGKHLVCNGTAPCQLVWSSAGHFLICIAQPSQFGDCMGQYVLFGTVWRILVLMLSSIQLLKLKSIYRGTIIGLPTENLSCSSKKQPVICIS